MIVAIRFDEPQSFLDTLYRRPPLSCLCVMNPDAELKKDADEVGFVAHSLEKEILEQVAGFEAFTVVEQRHAAGESRIGRDIHRSIVPAVSAMNSRNCHRASDCIHRSAPRLESLHPVGVELSAAVPVTRELDIVSWANVVHSAISRRQ